MAWKGYIKDLFVLIYNHSMLDLTAIRNVAILIILFVISLLKLKTYQKIA